MTHDAVLTALDVLGVLLFAAGVGAGLFPWLGWFALAVAGLVLLAASWGMGQLAARSSEAGSP